MRFGAVGSAGEDPVRVGDPVGDVLGDPVEGVVGDPYAADVAFDHHVLVRLEEMGR